MKLREFEDYGITDFTPREVSAVGSHIKDLQLSLMVAAQRFREDLDRRVKILSLTGGGHVAGSYHYMGRAMDVFLYAKDGEILIGDVFKAALNAGFNGVGIYWNGKCWSFHLDVRSKLGFWSAYKKKDERKWTYIPLTLDVKTYKKLRDMRF